MISYDDFQKTDIKLGKILSAERVPETDKLIRLMVDVGEDNPRQIVSGIALYSTAEDLVGRTFPFVTNLESRVIRGLESNGMILAASNDGEFSFLEPTSDITPGTRIG